MISISNFYESLLIYNGDKESLSDESFYESFIISYF